jgi:uncharacterized membrane protein YdcZ (DUF606 family)
MGDSSDVDLRRKRSSLAEMPFFSLMVGFLLLPIIPIQFTSIITAIVWSLSGPLAGVVFLVAGTFFRPDSLPILSGVQNIVGRMLPGMGTDQSGAIAVVIMLLGNLASACLFRVLLKSRLVKRLPFASRLRSAGPYRAGPPALVHDQHRTLGLPDHVG